MSIRIHGVAFCEHEGCLALTARPGDRLCPDCALLAPDLDSCLVCERAPGEALAADRGVTGVLDEESRALLEAFLDACVGGDSGLPFGSSARIAGDDRRWRSDSDRDVG